MLEVMLEDAGCDYSHLLSDCVQTKQWQHVCDVKREWPIFIIICKNNNSSPPPPNPRQHTHTHP